MFFLAKHNIVRGAQWEPLTSAVLCFSVSLCAHCMCVGLCEGPLNLPSIRDQEPLLSPSPRLVFFKEALLVDFHSLFRQRISLLTFSPASPCSSSSKNLASLFDNMGPRKNDRRTFCFEESQQYKLG